VANYNGVYENCDSLPANWRTAMGILSRIKRRLPIVGRSAEARPAAVADRPQSASTPLAAAAPEPPPPPPPPSRSSEDVRAGIAADIKEHPVLLYMKGNPAAPGCGFSAAVVDVLQQMDVSFETRDVLSDNALRQEIKEFSDWPTLPQLYVGGEFLGGCDIVREMHTGGELKEAIDKALG